MLLLRPSDAETLALCDAQLIPWSQGDAVTARLQADGIAIDRLTVFIDNNRAAAKTLNRQLCLNSSTSSSERAQQQRSCALTAWHRIVGRAHNLITQPGRAAGWLWTLQVSMPVSACEQANPPGSAVAYTAEQEALADQIDRIGYDDNAIKDLNQLLPAVKASGGGRIEATWNLAMGNRAFERGDKERAAELTIATSQIAATLGDDELLAFAKIDELKLLPDTRLINDAKAAVMRIGSPALLAKYYAAVGDRAFFAGKRNEAIPAYVKALRLFDAESLGPSAIEMHTRQNYATAIQFDGKVEEARNQFTNALKLSRIVVGPDHLDNVKPLLSLVFSHVAKKQMTEAEHYLAEARRLVDAKGATATRVGYGVQLALCQRRSLPSTVILGRIDVA